MTTRYALATIALALGAGAADAAIWRLEMTGDPGAGDSFGPSGAGAAPTGETPFAFAATFDEADERTGPVPTGFSVSAPQTATLSLAGAIYDILRVGENTESGIGLPLFDPSNVFNTGFWAFSFLANRLVPDPGIVARCAAASSGLDVAPSALAPTPWRGFLWAGYVSGKSMPLGPGGPAFAAMLAPVPLPGGLVLFGSAPGPDELVARRRGGQAGVPSPSAAGTAGPPSSFGPGTSNLPRQRST